MASQRKWSSKKRSKISPTPNSLHRGENNQPKLKVFCRQINILDYLIFLPRFWHPIVFCSFFGPQSKIMGEKCYNETNSFLLKRFFYWASKTHPRQVPASSTYQTVLLGFEVLRKYDQWVELLLKFERKNWYVELSCIRGRRLFYEEKIFLSRKPPMNPSMDPVLFFENLNPPNKGPSCNICGTLFRALGGVFLFEQESTFFAIFPLISLTKGVYFYLDRVFLGELGRTSIRAWNKQGGWTFIRTG